MKKPIISNRQRPGLLRNLAISSVAFLLMASGGTLHAGDWPQFRGPLGNGVSDEEGIPTTLDANKDLAWKADLPGRGLSSPIIIGDRIFITCSSGPKEQRLHVICLSASSGAKLWERQFWATGRTVCQSKTCVAANSPAADDKRIVAIFSSNDAVCLDHDGNLIWFRGLGRDYPNASDSLGMASSLLLAGGVAVAQIESDSDGFTVGLDLETGVNRWKLERPHEPNWTSPTLLKSGGTELALLLSHSGVTAVEAATGKIAWENTDVGSSIPSTASGSGVLYMSSKRGLTALQPGAPGEKPKQLWQSFKLRPGTPSPIVVGDKVFGMNDGGILTCGATSTGDILWQLRLKGPFSATPVAAGKFLYCVSENGVVQVVDTTKPEGAVVSEMELGETILSTPAISRGSIYFRSDGKLWKMGKPRA